MQEVRAGMVKEGGNNMSNLTAYLWGVTSVLLVEGVVMVLVACWLVKKVKK